MRLAPPLRALAEHLYPSLEQSARRRRSDRTPPIRIAGHTRYTSHLCGFPGPSHRCSDATELRRLLATSLFRESFWNSFYVSAMSVVVATFIALPLAYITTRFRFSGSILIQSLGFIPLIMPPFVGAVAMQLIFGRNGTINLLLRDHVGLILYGRVEWRDPRSVNPLLSIHPDQPFCLAPQHRPVNGGSSPGILAVTDCGSFGASFSRWQCQDISPALRWCSSRFFTWAHRCC